ncbi:MAG: bifunctional hydroxymethylpyrimidine kinase/phosphomethylpyrimidine kinase [Bacteroidales bacterium]|nr:bifunctional hydroxymethylpyrimidine kinase/phosphomethylpyrimidine kinase [Bacteroidales bacterium]
MHYSRVLTIAGSDSGGGAGIQADIKAISATGSYAASAITAVTVQNTLGVEAVHPVPVDIIAAQIRCVLSDIGADAIKIGMLHSAEVVLAVVAALKDASKPAAATSDGVASAAASPWLSNIVLDPVMVSTSGHRLIEDSAVEVLQRELLPMARVITPNVPEAEVLAGRSIKSGEDFPSVARALSAGGRVSVLMKAGHLGGSDASDLFYNAEEDRISVFSHPRIDTPNTHGTGCTLSSALASYLAQGLPLNDAVGAAIDYTSGAIASGAAYSIGHGHGPVDHFYRTRK